jgi:hypothetical protein
MEQEARACNRFDTIAQRAHRRDFGTQRRELSRGRSIGESLQIASLMEATLLEQPTETNPSPIQ